MRDAGIGKVAHGCAEICTLSPVDRPHGVAGRDRGRLVEPAPPRRPRSWPEWPRVTVKPSRFVGVIVTAAVLGAAVLYYRDTREAGSDAAASGARRGARSSARSGRSRGRSTV